jgi:uncharacterized protein
MVCGMPSPPSTPPQPPPTTADPVNRFDPSLLDILRCPVTRSRLRMEDDWLVAEVGGLSYPIRDGIPVMLEESAKLPAGFTSLEQFKEKYKATDDADAQR